MVENNIEKNNWKSLSGFVWSASSVAIGLGNIWRFPYLCAKYGGISFIIAYFLVLFLATIPAIILEIGLSKSLHKANIGCYSFALNSERAGIFFGLITSGSAFVVNFTYMVTTGYCGLYAVTANRNGWYQNDISSFYQLIIDNKWVGLLAGICVLVITITISYKDINVLEKICKILVPVIGIILIFLFFWTFSLDGIFDGYKRLICFEGSWWKNFDFWLAVFGQVMFSVGLGPGLFLAYGSHLPDDSNVVVGAISVAALDTLISVLAAVIIVPSSTVFGYGDGYGSELAFLVYPTIFSQIRGGMVLGILFFLLLFFAAISSCVGQITIFLTTITDEFKLNRKKTCLVLAIITLIGMGPSMYSSLVNDIVNRWISDYLLTTTALISIITFGWIYGVKKIRVHHINKTGGNIGTWFDLQIRYISTPILIVIIISMIMNIIQN